MTAELVVILVLVLLNGVFAMSEIAILASRKVRLQQRAEDGDRRAAQALALKRDPTALLSTVQVGITLVGILAGAYSGATVADTLAERIGGIPQLAPYRQGIALGLVVGAITYLSLVIGELVPKALALHDPEGIARIVAGPLSVLARIGAPVVRLLGASTGLVLRLLRIAPTGEQTTTEEEIRALVKQAAQTGDVAPVEHAIVEQVFRLGDRRASAIMTPRHAIDWIDVREGVSGVGEHLATDKHPRLLVCDGELDKVLGIADSEDLLESLLAGRPIDLRGHLKPAIFVPATMSVFRLLETFRSSRVHVAIVLDEFGAVEGLVTPTDILEALVGLMPSEPAEDAGPLVQREDGSWLVEGTARIDEIEATLQLPPVPEAERGAYETLAGLVMARLGRVPRAGDHFTWDEFRLEVVDMDGRRVDKVLVERRPASRPAPDDR